MTRTTAPDNPYAPQRSNATYTATSTAAPPIDSSVNHESDFSYSVGQRADQHAEHAGHVHFRCPQSNLADTGSLPASSTVIYQHAQNDPKPPTFAQVVQRAQFIENGAMLAIICAIAICKGAILFFDAHATSQPSACVESTLSLVHGVLALFLSITGFMIGLIAIIYHLHNRDITKCVMASQMLMTFYVMLYYLFPITDDRAEWLFVFTSLRDDSYITTIGKFITLQPCLSLHAAVFFFMARLVCITGESIPNKTGFDKFLEKTSCSYSGGILWNINLLMFGVWVFTEGCLLYQGMILLTGFVIVACALWGISIVTNKTQPTTRYHVLAFCMTSLAVFNLAVMQPRMVQGASSGAVTSQAGLVFVTVFLGPYFVLVERRAALQETPRTD